MLRGDGSRPSVICLDLGGPATQVTEQTGFKVAAHDPEQVVSSLAEAMKELAVSQELREQMGEAARQRIVQEFSWSRRAEKISALYYSVMKSRQPPSKRDP
jgi:glycosyltransferase involved in cell wall biosynthesis